MEKLMAQVARILSESDVYKCGFTAIGGTVYAVITKDGGIKYQEIDAAKWLEDVKGA